MPSSGRWHIRVCPKCKAIAPPYGDELRACGMHFPEVIYPEVVEVVSVDHLRGAVSADDRVEAVKTIAMNAVRAGERKVDGLQQELIRLRAALERVEAHGSGYAVKIAREALAELDTPPTEGAV